MVGFGRTYSKGVHLAYVFKMREKHARHIVITLPENGRYRGSGDVPSHGTRYGSIVWRPETRRHCTKSESTIEIVETQAFIRVNTGFKVSLSQDLRASLIPRATPVCEQSNRRIGIIMGEDDGSADP